MTTKFDELMRDPEFRKGFAVEGLIGDTAQLIWDLMERRNMKQADLARLLNKTPAFVSQLLNGKANMTVRTLAEVVYALKATGKVEALDENASNCETVDEVQMQIFRTQMPARSSGPRFNWENFNVEHSNSSGDDARPGVAA